MSNLKETVADMMKMDGALGAAVLDTESGLALATAGHGAFDMEVTAGGAVDVLRAWNKGSAQTDRQNPVQSAIGIYPDTIAMVRVLDGRQLGLALLLLLERERGNQALANHHLGLISERIVV